MKIVIAGGTGQLGQTLAGYLHAKGHEVVIFGRHTSASRIGRFRPWDGRTVGDWIEDLEGSDVLINLCGRSVDCRYTKKNRREILESRISPTRLLGQALHRLNLPPKTWLQASTATLYSHRYDAPNDELSGVIGGHEPEAPRSWDFSIQVAREWEHAALETCPKSTRLVLLRAAMVMGTRSGGVFDRLLQLVRLGLGGTVGRGDQYVSWIHEADFCRAVLWTMNQQTLVGPINLCAPAPLPNSHFMKALREAWGIRAGLPSPSPLLSVAAFFLRTETELLLKSRRVVPGRLLTSGFTFDFPDWREAAEELCQRWKGSQSSSPAQMHIPRRTP